MNNVNKLAKNFISSVTGSVVGQFINFVIMMYLPRVLGPSGYGIFSFSQSYIMYFFLICDLGLSLYCVREVNQRKNINLIVNKIYTVKFYLSLFSTLLFFATIFFISKSSQTRNALICIGLSIFFYGITVDYLFNAFSDMKYSGFSVAIKNIVFGALCLLLIRSSKDVNILALSYTISLLMAQLFLFIKFNKKYFPLKITKPSLLDFKILKQALPLSLSVFMVQINNNFDIIYLSFSKTQIEVGYYSAPYKIINFLITILCIYFSAAYPSIAELLKKNRGELNDYIQKFYKAGIIFVMPIVFGGIALSDKIIYFLFGSQYTKSSLLFSILLPLIFIRLVTSTYGAVLIMGDGSRYFSIGVIIGAMLNVVLNILLVPRYGSKGSAIATLICESVQGIYLYYKYLKYCDAKFLKINIEILIPTIGMYILLVYMRCNLIISFLIGIIVYFLMLFILLNAKKYLMSEVIKK